MTGDGVETVLYLDDSGSMTWTGEFRLGTGTRLHQGRMVLVSLAPLVAVGRALLIAPATLAPRVVDHPENAPEIAPEIA